MVVTKIVFHPASWFKSEEKSSPTILGDVFIHETATVDQTAVLGPNVSIGKNVKVGAGTRIKESIVLGEK